MIIVTSEGRVLGGELIRHSPRSPDRPTRHSPQIVAARDLCHTGTCFRLRREGCAPVQMGGHKQKAMIFFFGMIYPRHVT